MKKRILSSITAVMLAVTVLTACSGGETGNDDKLSIVCSTFPQYDWTMSILGDKSENWDVTLLLDSGTDLHNYQPTADDMITVNSSDLFVYVGGESDEWAADTLKQGTGTTVAVVLMDMLDDSALLEEEHDHDVGDDHEEEKHEHENDEHVWLSLKNAVVFCDGLTEFISDADPDNADEYKANCEAYTEKLRTLDEKYETAVAEAKHDSLVICDRYPFVYMAADYSLSCYAAFSGCSAETEASFETIIALADKVDELGLTSIVIIDSSDGQLANTVISNTETADQNIVTLDSMQSVTASDIEAGTTYLGIMEQNLDALTTALN